MEGYMKNVPMLKMQEEDEVDAFRLVAQGKPAEIMIQNINQRTLMALPDQTESNFTAQFVQDCCTDNQSKFFLHIYMETLPPRGMPVLLSVIVDNTHYIMCSDSDYSISFKKGELPIDIPSKQSEFIFYQKSFSAGHSTFSFESSVKQNFYLAFEEDGSVQKLILKHCPPGKLDETIQMNVLL